MEDPKNTLLITDKIYTITLEAARVAVKYEKLTGRKLGITGEIGEILTCKNQELKLSLNPLTAGYDAIDSGGNRYQIKSRRTNHRRGSIGSFSQHSFDYAILAILDPNYKISELRKTSYEKLKPFLDKYQRRNPKFNDFIRVSEVIWVQDNQEDKNKIPNKV